MYFRQSEAIKPDIIRDLFGYLPDELTAWHIQKLREHFGDEDPEKTVKVHWRLKNFVGDEYEKIEPFLSVLGNHEFDEWDVIVRRKSITVENKNDDRKYSGDTSHTFMTYTDDETRTEIYHDAFVTLEVLAEEEDNCCVPVEITVNESGIVVDVLYGKDEYFMGIDEVEEKCGGLPWFDDEASVMYTLLS